MVDSPPVGPRIYERIASVTQALAAPARLRAMNFLAQAPYGVDELAQLLKQSEATTSAQLKVLHQAGLVTREKTGRRAIFRIANDSALALWIALRNHILAHDPESRAVMVDVEQQAPAWPDSLRALHKRAKDGSVRVLDLRPTHEWDAGHLPYAEHIPFDELSRSLRMLPNDEHYVIYCRGPFCARAIAGTQRLIRNGRDAQRLAADISDWRVAGLPVKTEAKEP